MHEMSIALGIIDVAAEEAERLGGVCVRAVRLKWGPLSGVVKEALISSFEIAREGSPLEGCELVIEDVPVVVHCPACGREGPIDSIQEFTCRWCGAPSAQVLRGRELEVVGLEVEECAQER